MAPNYSGAYGVQYQTSLADNALVTFFELMAKNMKKLQELTLKNWEFKFQNYEETCQKVGQLARSCSELKKLKLNGSSEVRSGLTMTQFLCSTTLLHNLVHNLPRLTHLSLCKYQIDARDFDSKSAERLGNCFHDHWNPTNKFDITFFGLYPEVRDCVIHMFSGTVASSSSVTRRVLAESSIESHIQIPTHKGFISG